MQQGLVMQNFGLEIWGDDNFLIKEGRLALNYADKPTILEITQAIREKGYKGPLLLRFPHLIKKQISTLFETQWISSKKLLSEMGDFKFASIDDLVRAIKDMIRQSLYHKTSWKAKVRQFDKEHLNGNLARFKRLVFP